jgi:hypothetical protein
MTGRFERTEDGGQTWAEIDPQVMRQRLGNTYRDVDAVIAAMIEDGLPVRTSFASYRYAPPEPPTVEEMLTRLIGYPPTK